MEATGYLALLRGINVGGKNRLPMKALAQFFVDAGCQHVATFIQSGNVIFHAPGDVTGLPALISQRIAEAFAIKVPVQFRSAAQLRQTVADNPYLAAGLPEESLHVAFLAEAPGPDRIAALDPDRSPGDRYTVRGQSIYLHLPNGFAVSRLTNAYFDAKLATVSTARNWRTVTKLLAMVDGQAPRGRGPG